MNNSTQQKSEWSTKRLLEWTTVHFSKAEVDQPRLCAELLLAHVLGCQRIDLYIKFDYCPNEKQLAEFRGLVQRCGAGEPAAYLTGKAHFYSLEFEVGPGCLIPRPETETLVAQAIDFCRHETHRPVVEVLDLCTGSGCVAVSIAANVVETEITAVDSSSAALEIARRNIQKHDLQGRITLLESDLFDRVNEGDKGVFDLMVANPPYISTTEYEKLSRSIRDYEPKDAFLADEGALMIEMAYDQAEAVVALFEQAGYLKDITTAQDNLGHRRVVRATRKVN